MTDATVLLVTGLDQHGVNHIVEELGRRAIPVLRLNLDDAEPVHLSARFDHDGRWSGQIEQYGRSASLRHVSAIWCRSVRRPPGDPAIPDPDDRAWAEQISRPILCKPFAPIGTQPTGWVPAVEITEPVPPGSLAAMSIFQEIVRGAHMRVTVVGGRVFAAQITPPGGDLDWRMKQIDADYRAVEVPRPVRDAILAYQRHYGLVFGALDLVVDEGGTWWFLENNPVGQYAFIEDRTGQPITAAIVDHLCPASASPDSALTKVAR